MGKDMSILGFLFLTLICIIIWAPFVTINKFMLFNYTREEHREKMYIYNI